MAKKETMKEWEASAKDKKMDKKELRAENKKREGKGKPKVKGKGKK